MDSRRQAFEDAGIMLAKDTSAGQGHWIWDAFHRETPNRLMLFRRTVTASSPLVHAQIRVAARGSFRVWANGRFVAHHDVQSPTPGSDSILIDLGSSFEPGSRDLAIVIAVHLLGIGTHHQPRSLGGLLVSGTLLEVSGAETTLDSSEEWETHVPAFWRQNAPQMVWSTGYTEWWDRTPPDLAAQIAEIDSWGSAVVFDDDQRPTPYEREVIETRMDLEQYRTEIGWTGAPTGSFSSRADECVASGLIRSPDEPAVDAWRYHLFILERQQVGFLEFTVEAEEDCTLDVIMSERVDASGWPVATRQGIEAIDTIVVSAGTTTHRFFNRRSFRALAIIARTSALVVTRSVAIHTVTAKRSRPSLRTGDDRVADMFETSVHTAEIGRQDFYEDCPLREGGHYVADARVQALLDILSTGETALAARSLRQFAREQDADGMVPALSPSGTRHRIPDFSLQWIAYLEDYVRLTGDVRLLEELRDPLEATLRWVDTQWDAEAGTFSIDRAGWWAFIDWHPFEDTALQAAVDAQYVASIYAAGELMDLLGEGERARRYRSRASDDALRLRTRWRHPHAAVTLVNALPPALWRDCVDTSVIDGFVADTGYQNLWTCLALINIGQAREAQRLMNSYWGAMLDAGARTWWERFAIDREVTESTGSSLCHPWSAGPLILLPILSSGSNPLARDKTTASFAPALAGIVAEFSLRTPFGDWTANSHPLPPSLLAR